MPWDTGSVFAHGTVLHDPIDGLWKAWQHSMPAPAGKPEKFESRWWQPRLTYLESKDGVHWQRPKLKFVPWKGHAETNILLDGYNSYASVNIDPGRKDAPYEMFAFRHPATNWLYERPSRRAAALIRMIQRRRNSRFRRLRSR